MPSVVQEWLSGLPFKLQTTMLCAVRGCDGVAREDVVKTMARGIRKMTLLPSQDKVTSEGGFMYFDLPHLRPAVEQVCEDLGKYPHHYVHHILVACEVLGYFHPVAAVREAFYYAYHQMCKEMNVYPETKEQCWVRGNEK